MSGETGATTSRLLNRLQYELANTAADIGTPAVTDLVPIADVSADYEIKSVTPDELLTAAGVTASPTELNILDGVTATAAELNILDDTVADVDIALAAGAANTMTITITCLDGAAVAIDAVHLLEVWISEAATGIGLTGDSYSGDVTVTTGTEWEELTTKKHYRVLTDVNGVAVLSAVDSGKPADQYIAVKHPVTGKIIVSAASGANWGA